MSSKLTQSLTHALALGLGAFSASMLEADTVCPPCPELVPVVIAPVAPIAPVVVPESVPVPPSGG